MKKISDDFYKWLFGNLYFEDDTFQVKLRCDSLDKKYIAKYTDNQHILKSLYMWTFTWLFRLKYRRELKRHLTHT